MKRPVDVIGASILLVVFGPLFAIVTIGVLATMGRPAVFRQRRLTKGGVPFTMFKFRSMKPEDPWDESVLGPRPHHAGDDDPRHTTFGQFIRRFSLDELPQLWNVVKGDMSLIGPRPELPAVADEFGLVDHPRHLVRPGMTGEWQVSELRAGFVHMNVHLDALYVGDLTLRRDLAIAFRTIGLFIGVGPKAAILPEPAQSEPALSPRPLRVLHVLEPAISGVPGYVQELGKELASRGIEQVVLTSDVQEWDFSGWAEAVVQVPWRRRLGDVLSVGKEVRRVVMDNDIDLVHAHATFAGMATRAVRLDVPVLYQPHGWGHLSPRRRLAREVSRWVERRLDSRTDVLLVLSDQEAAEAPFDRPMERVSPIVDLDRFRPLSDANRLRSRLALGWSSSEKVFLCVGEFSHRKNQTALLRSWANADTEGCRLVLVGDGPTRSEVDKLVSDGVDLLGWRDDVDWLMAVADALVVPSLGEGFSLVFLEALASGLPVFTTAVGGSEVVIGDDGVVRANAAGVLRAAMESPLVGPTLDVRTDRADRCRQQASIETVVEAFLDVYRAAAGIPGVLESTEDESMIRAT